MFSTIESLVVAEHRNASHNQLGEEGPDEDPGLCFAVVSSRGLV